MKDVFSKTLLPYVIAIVLSLTVTGLIIWQTNANLLLLIAMIVIESILLIVLLSVLYNKYVKPIQKAASTINEITKGNYSARFHSSASEVIGELSLKINSLARNMSEISMQEQMQSEQLSTIIDNMQSGLVLIDEKGYIHVVNRKFISMFGKDVKDYRGYLYYDVLEVEKFHEAVQKTFLYERNIKESFTLRQGVNTIHLEIIGAPIFNERNMLKGAVLVLYDITELKKLEKTRKDFVANVSHELKTPITSIKGFSETLLDSGLNNEETTKEFLTIIYNESHRLQLLIDDLLSLSRLEKDDFRLVLNKVKVKELIEEVIPALKHKAEKKGLVFTVDADEDMIMKVDKERIKQVIINLLDNAIHYTPGNGSIELYLGHVKDYIHIKVADSGIGIEQNALPRIFERFYRVDKARSRNTGGTGLGLAIVKHIVEVHDGKIEVESEVNQGTTVHVYLPK
ncbi:two-component system histidine kinase PnpS [Oceanobacillus damuensis]|uniref:two-component system histidine kinase PnpS n=1 Tax=Oceanobacillus damuensis TaxID=937928 RepID=UPI0008359FE2|nr:HAMP domain-containing sensor histidine kinase [Oceanobacillus damuensis]